MKTTHWFPCNTKPVHVGWYECDYGTSKDTCMRYWDGTHWNMEVEGDMRKVYHFGRELDHCWRGLTEPATTVVEPVTTIDEDEEL